MNNYNPDKLAQHSKANRARGMIAIRGATQQGNIYQQEHKDHVRIPQKNERRAMDELPIIGGIDLVPVKREDRDDDLISG
jgi:hypothetical protein